MIPLRAIVPIHTEIYHSSRSSREPTHDGDGVTLLGQSACIGGKRRYGFLTQTNREEPTRAGQVCFHGRRPVGRESPATVVAVKKLFPPEGRGSEGRPVAGTQPLPRLLWSVFVERSGRQKNSPHLPIRRRSHISASRKGIMARKMSQDEKPWKNPSATSAPHQL